MNSVSARVDAIGLVGYVKGQWERQAPLPYPLSDPSRWTDIADDADSDDDLRAAARYLISVGGITTIHEIQY